MTLTEEPGLESSLAMEHLMSESNGFGVQLRKVIDFLLLASNQFIQVLVFILEPLRAENNEITIAIFFGVIYFEAECATGNALATFLILGLVNP